MYVLIDCGIDSFHQDINFILIAIWTKIDSYKQIEISREEIMIIDSFARSWFKFIYYLKNPSIFINMYFCRKFSITGDFISNDRFITNIPYSGDF